MPDPASGKTMSIIVPSWTRALYRMWSTLWLSLCISTSSAEGESAKAAEARASRRKRASFVMAEVLETAQFPTGARRALGVILHKIVRTMHCGPEHVDAPQGFGCRGAKICSIVACELKGCPWLGLQGLARPVWGRVAMV